MKILSGSLFIKRFICLLCVFIFVSCNNKNNKQTITLLPGEGYKSNSSYSYLDSIIINYEELKNSTQLVDRIFYFHNQPSINLRYRLINQDSLIFIQPQFLDEKRVYLNFNGTKVSNLFFLDANSYYSGGFRYIKKEIYKDKNNNTSDSLFVFYGKDMGFDNEEDSLYYFFDSKIRLRKILTSDNRIMLIDKEITN